MLSFCKDPAKFRVAVKNLLKFLLRVPEVERDPDTFLFVCLEMEAEVAKDAIKVL